jgi:DNA-binding transcriptional LysR family regulator
MELRHLRYFVAAAEEENFGRASERLHVTRPAVSQIIADLEDELGAAVFDRLPHRVRLTAAGRALLPELQRILIELESALTLARDVSQGRSGRLNIAYGDQTVMHTIFRSAVHRYRDSCPSINLELHESGTPDQAKAMAEGRFDGAFMHFGPSLAPRSAKVAQQNAQSVLSEHDLALEWVPIQTSRVGVAVPDYHPLARRNSVKLGELATEGLVDVGRSAFSVRSGAFRALCREYGFEPNVIHEVATTSAQLNLVAAGMGIGLMVCGSNFIYPHGLRIVPLSDVHYPVNFVFSWVKGRMTPALERLIEIIQDLASVSALPAESVLLSRVGT